MHVFFDPEGRPFLLSSEMRWDLEPNAFLARLCVVAVLILGEALIKSFRKREYLRMSEYALAVVLGCLVYSAGIQGLLALRIDFVDLRLLTALFLLILLGVAGRAHSSSTRLF